MLGDERQQVPGFEPVTVRVIEFPLTDSDTALRLPPGIFPSPFQQLRSGTSDPYAWQIYKPYSLNMQTLMRLKDACQVAVKKHASTYGRLIDMEVSWVDKLGLSESVVVTTVPRVIGLWVSAVTVMAGYRGYCFIEDGVWRWLGIYEAKGIHGDGSEQAHQAVKTMSQCMGDLTDLFMGFGDSRTMSELEEDDEDEELQGMWNEWLLQEEQDASDI